MAKVVAIGRLVVPSILIMSKDITAAYILQLIVLLWLYILVGVAAGAVADSVAVGREAVATLAQTLVAALAL